MDDVLVEVTRGGRGAEYLFLKYDRVVGRVTFHGGVTESELTAYGVIEGIGTEDMVDFATEEEDGLWKL